jgi:hypothetical protein
MCPLTPPTTNGEVESFEGDIYYQIQSPVVGVSITGLSVAGD